MPVDRAGMRVRSLVSAYLPVNLFLTRTRSLCLSRIPRACIFHGPVLPGICTKPAAGARLREAGADSGAATYLFMIFFRPQPGLDNFP